jgi:hypothetical protein
MKRKEELGVMCSDSLVEYVISNSSCSLVPNQLQPDGLECCYARIRTLQALGPPGVIEKLKLKEQVIWFRPPSASK